MTTKKKPKPAFSDTELKKFAIESQYLDSYLATIMHGVQESFRNASTGTDYDLVLPRLLTYFLHGLPQGLDIVRTFYDHIIASDGSHAGIFEFTPGALYLNEEPEPLIDATAHHVAEAFLARAYYSLFSGDVYFSKRMTEEEAGEFVISNGTMIEDAFRGMRIDKNEIRRLSARLKRERVVYLNSLGKQKILEDVRKCPSIDSIKDQEHRDLFLYLRQHRAEALAKGQLTAVIREYVNTYFDGVNGNRSKVDAYRKVAERNSHIWMMDT